MSCSCVLPLWRTQLQRPWRAGVSGRRCSGLLTTISLTGHGELLSLDSRAQTEGVIYTFEEWVECCHLLAHYSHIDTDLAWIRPTVKKTREKAMRLREGPQWSKKNISDSQQLVNQKLQSALPSSGLAQLQILHHNHQTQDLPCEVLETTSFSPKYLLYLSVG